MPYILILITPSALYFSRLDWFQILNLPINLQLFATDISFTYVLCSGILLFSIEIFIQFSSQLEKIRKEILNRGANEKDAEEATMKQFTFTSAVVIMSAATSLAITNILFLLKEAIQNSTKLIPYPYIALGAISATTLGISILIYLRAKAAEDQKSLSKPKKSDYFN